LGGCPRARIICKCNFGVTVLPDWT